MAQFKKKIRYIALTLKESSAVGDHLGFFFHTDNVLEAKYG